MKIRPVLVFGAAFCALSSFRLAAQDVTVGEVQSFSTDPAPEVMPKPKRKLRPDYPDELRKTGEVGYVVITRYLDPMGKSLSLGAVGTHIPFQRAVETEFREWDMAPAKNAGKNVASLVWIPVIFNPKMATAKGAEATPRLLAVTPVVTKDRPTAAGQPPVVRMKLSIDATGAITSAEPEGEVKDTVLPAIREALKTWKFAPARAGGQPVAAQMTVPVLCQRPMPKDIAQRSPPKVIKQAAPVYPLALRREGLRGEVLLDFEVDDKGRVQNPVIESSNNPAFNEPAIAALRQWTFEPAQNDGKPVKARMRIPIVFNLNGGGRDAFEVQAKGNQDKLPESLRYDTPAKIIGVVVPVYPYALRQAEVGGKAKALLMVDPRGRVTDVKVLAADRPEFGLALTAALDGFKFDPAMKDGKPVAHVLNYEHAFDGFDNSDRVSDQLQDLEKKHPEAILGMSKLDRPITPVSRRGAVSPTAWPAGVVSGEALVELLIDKEGHARLPRIVSATADCFGYAAVQAVIAWQFEPPLAGGKAVVARVRVPFKFTSSESKPTPAATAADEAKK